MATFLAQSWSMRASRPTGGGSLEQTVQLNVTWGGIERQFKEHGHQLW